MGCEDEGGWDMKGGKGEDEGRGGGRMKGWGYAGRGGGRMNLGVLEGGGG